LNFSSIDILILAWVGVTLLKPGLHLGNRFRRQNALQDDQKIFPIRLNESGQAGLKLRLAGHFPAFCSLLGSIRWVAMKAKTSALAYLTQRPNFE